MDTNTRNPAGVKWAAPLALLLVVFACSGERRAATVVPLPATQSSAAATVSTASVSASTTSTTSSSAPSDLPDGAELLGSKRSMEGNVAIGPGFIWHGSKRDAVVIAYQDGLEGEPLLGWFVVLDAETDRVFFREAWDLVPTDDEQSIVYGAAFEVKGDGALLARQLGVSKAKIKAARFDAGSGEGSWVVRPVVLDLRTGRGRVIDVLGGGSLAMFEGKLVGTVRPHYWATGKESAKQIEIPRVLDLAAGKWQPLPASKRKAALRALAPKTTTISGDCPEKGTALAKTRDGKLALFVVKPCFTVRAARLELEKP